MNGIALLMAVAALGVDYQVETTADKQQQYTIQIEPEILKLVAGGEEIHSEVPIEAGQVQRLCIRIGLSKVPRTPTGEAAFRQLLVSGSRWASADRALTSADAPTILWPARANPEQTYNLRYGWQPDAEGKQSYFVQLDPTLLRTLAAGDEIYAPIDPAAGRLNRFVVSLTKKDLPPRVAGQAFEPPQPAVMPLQSGGQTTIGLLPMGGGQSQFPANPVARHSVTGSRDGVAGYDVTGSRDGVAGYGGTGRAGDFNTLPPVEVPSAPSTFGSSAGNYSSQQPRQNLSATAPPLIDHRAGAHSPANSGFSPAGNYAPQIADSRGYSPGGGAGGFAPAAPNATYGTNGTYATNGAYSQPNSGFGAMSDNRMAANNLPPPPSAGLPTVTTGSLTGSTAPDVPQKETWGIFVVVLFALFFSIGGNLYLAWTALEFHNRYRSAIDRLRSAARSG
jgi:hypothetical protein